MKVTERLERSGTFKRSILRQRMKLRKHACWNGGEVSTNVRGCEEAEGSIFGFNMSNRKATSSSLGGYMKVDIDALDSYSANTKESLGVDGQEWDTRPRLVHGDQVRLYAEQCVKYRDSLLALFGCDLGRS